jgi:adenosylmethionine-8-amino-7-oxononanoate aminotransferase
MNYEELLLIDKKHIWHPCAQMKDYEEYPAIFIERGEGVWLIKKDGSKILDAISSWWTNLFGHANPYIIDKIKKQLDKLEHVLFANYTHEPAITLSKYLTGLFNNNLDKVFFTDNGSSCIEAALKMSFHYWYNTGYSNKKKFAYISGGYHGETLGALSVGAMDTYKKIYLPLLPKTIQAPGPDCFKCRYNLNRETCNAECFKETLKVIEKNHKNLACFIIEPILQGAAGMKIYSPVFLKKLREACTAYNVHLICDEIASGFGRTGKMMASHHADIIPDFAVVSKGVTSGYLPLAALLTSQKIFDAFYGEYTDLKAFVHSHTYSGNPLASSAGCAVFELFDKLDIIKKNIDTGSYIKQKAMEFSEYKFVGEIRSIGMVTAIELVRDKQTKEPFDWKNRIGYKIYRTAEKKGVLLRNIQDVIYFIPPYIINKEEIDFMINIAFDSIREILG